MFFSPFRKLCFVNLGILIYVLNSSNSYAQHTVISVENQPQISGSVVLGQGENLFHPFNEINEFNHQNLCNYGWKISFALNESGDIPQTPEQDFSARAVQIGLVEAAPTDSEKRYKINNQTITTQSSKSLQQLIENKVSPTQGWIRNNKGEVVLSLEDISISLVQPRTVPMRCCYNPVLDAMVCPCR